MGIVLTRQCHCLLKTMDHRIQRRIRMIGRTLQLNRLAILPDQLVAQMNGKTRSFPEMPASPPRSTTCPSPPPASCQRPKRSADSCSLPIKPANRPDRYEIKPTAQRLVPRLPDLDRRIEPFEGHALRIHELELIADEPLRSPNPRLIDWVRPDSEAGRPDSAFHRTPTVPWPFLAQ